MFPDWFVDWAGTALRCLGWMVVAAAALVLTLGGWDRAIRWIRCIRGNDD